MTTSNFQNVVKVFIELRHKGLSLSAADLYILEQWESGKIDPDFICQVMLEMFAECQKKSKGFPKSFVKINKRVNHIIAKMKDV